MNTLNKITALLHQQDLILQILLVLLFTAIIYYIAHFVLHRLNLKAEKTHANWDKILINAVHKPLGILILFLGISYSIDIIRIELNQVIFHAIDPLRDLVVVAILTWFLIRFIDQCEWAYAHRELNRKKKIDVTTIVAIAKVTRACVIIAAALAVLDVAGYSVSGILALGGVGTLIAGLAAKDLLANFFGGLMIYFDRPFKLNDDIRSPDGNIEGTVEYIGWRLCRIRTPDKRALYIPNSIFSTISVENSSRMLNRRIHTTIGLRYGDADKLAKTIGEIKEILRQHPDIDQSSKMYVNFTEFAPSALNFIVSAYTKTTDLQKFQDVQQDIFFKILNTIAENKAECAFPSTTIYMPDPVMLTQK